MTTKEDADSRLERNQYLERIETLECGLRSALNSLAVHAREPEDHPVWDFIEHWRKECPTLSEQRRLKMEGGGAA